MSANWLDWKAPGPVAAAFAGNKASLSAIMGPVGSAKTTTCLIRALRAACAQPPSPIDGVRRHRHLILRDTMVNLERTVLPTWHGWFPKSVGHWVGGPPARHTIPLRVGGAQIEFQLDLMGIGEHSVENLLRSYEMSTWHLNEADLTGYEAVAFLQQRAGRYPSKIHGGCAFAGGWMDFNAPEQDHWLHTLCVDGIIPTDSERKVEDFLFFRQPGAREPGAENIENLPTGYYERIIKTQPDYMVRRMVDNLWGYSRDGKPVYPEFNDFLHVAQLPLPIRANVPLGIGLDGGGTPAAAFGHWLPGDMWEIVGEIATGPGTGPHRFGEMLVEWFTVNAPEHLTRLRRGGDVEWVYGWADPSTVFGEDETDDRDPHWLDKVRKVTGINFRPTATNAPAMRQEAIRNPLRRLVDGKPAFLLSPTCKTIRKGFNSGYRYKKVRSMDGSGRYDTKPEKNMWSHIMEALEYLPLGGGNGIGGIMGRERSNDKKLVTADSDYSVFGD